MSCDGGGGPLGHPKIFINVDKPQICWCTYCGLPFVCSSSMPICADQLACFQTILTRDRPTSTTGSTLSLFRLHHTHWAQRATRPRCLNHKGSQTSLLDSGEWSLESRQHLYIWSTKQGSFTIAETKSFQKVAPLNELTHAITFKSCTLLCRI